MLTAVFLSTLLMLGGLGGAAVSDLQVYGKLINGDKTLLSSNNVRRQPHQQLKSEMHRSLDLESFNVHVTPTTSKLSLPTIVKLYPPTAKPLHMHANMPMRFGRDSSAGDDRVPNSSPNMPQRFGRNEEVIQLCAKCPNVREPLKPPQRFERNSLHWSLLRTLVNAQLLHTGLHCKRKSICCPCFPSAHCLPEDFDITTSSEEVKV